MDNKEAYNIWAEQYDTNRNRTRDLEATALRTLLGKITFDHVLEVGCGTGKNSVWFTEHAQSVTALDFSEEMLAFARAKTAGNNITFRQADITQEWPFPDMKFDLISFSLVLEHIENLDFIFGQIKQRLGPGGHVYIGELHPFKQYSGSLARFDIGDQRVELQCHVHHVSEFTQLAAKYGLSIVALEEWFDEDNRATLPRLLTLVLKY